MAVSPLAGGTNIDVNGLVSKLMTVEQRPVTLLDKKTASFQSQISAYGQVTSAMSTFQTAVQTLNKASTFQANSTTVSDSTVFSATADTTALAGTYSLSIGHLAQAQTLMTTGQASSTTGLGNGATTLNFQFGTAGVPGSFGAVNSVAIGANSTLQDISNAVNAANIGVNATIVNDGSANPYRLVFTAATSGVSNSMSVATTDGALNFLNYDEVGAAGKSMTETAAAQDAALTVNGLAVSSTTNTVTGAIQGVTLNLTNKTTSAVSLTVSRDNTAIQTAVSGFVSSFNTLNNLVKSLTAYNAATKTGGPLVGDAAMRTLQSELRNVLSTTRSTGSLTTLSEVGISIQKDGSLALDSTKLTSAIKNNFSDVLGLFAGDGIDTPGYLPGYASKFSDFANNMLGNVGLGITGILQSRTEGLNRTVTDLGKKRDLLSARLVTIEASYRRQFSQLDAMLGSMSATSSFLTQQASYSKTTG